MLFILITRGITCIKQQEKKKDPQQFFLKPNIIQQRIFAVQIRVYTTQGRRHHKHKYIEGIEQKLFLLWLFTH